MESKWILKFALKWLGLTIMMWLNFSLSPFHKAIEAFVWLFKVFFSTSSWLNVYKLVLMNISSNIVLVDVKHSILVLPSFSSFMVHRIQTLFATLAWKRSNEWKEMKEKIIDRKPWLVLIKNAQHVIATATCIKPNPFGISIATFRKTSAHDATILTISCRPLFDNLLCHWFAWQNRADYQAHNWLNKPSQESFAYLLLFAFWLGNCFLIPKYTI